MAGLLSVHLLLLRSRPEGRRGFTRTVIVRGVLATACCGSSVPTGAPAPSMTQSVTCGTGHVHHRRVLGPGHREGELPRPGKQKRRPPTTDHMVTGLLPTKAAA